MCLEFIIISTVVIINQPTFKMLAQMRLFLQETLEKQIKNVNVQNKKKLENFACKKSETKNNKKTKSLTLFLLVAKPALKYIKMPVYFFRNGQV